MPITYTSEREGRVALWIYPESFTVEELFIFIDDFQQEVLDKTKKKVYFISDFTAVKHLPPNIMSAGLRMMKKTHPMMGTMIEVTPNGFLYALATVLAKLAAPGTVSIQRTRDEAFKEVDRLLALEPQETSQEIPSIHS